MTRLLILPAVLCLFVFAACGKAKKEEMAAKQPVKAVDVCALLPASDIQAIQGEALVETKPTTPPGNAFTVAQCFFTLPSNTNSIVVTVTQSGTGPGAKDAKEFWEETFGEGEGKKEGKGEREREREEEGKKAPLKVEGVGDEAFWTGNSVGGALYVLKGDLFLRVSTGGSDQLERCKRLAEVALKHL